MLAAIAPVIVAYQYYPQYGQTLAYVAVIIIFAILIALPANAYIRGRAIPHIEHSIRTYPTGVALGIKDFYIDAPPEPGGKILDVYYLGQLTENGHEVALKLQGQFWYPYLVKTRWPVDVADFSGADRHIFVLPKPWSTFLVFAGREQAAYLSGEVFDHPASEHLESYLAPFKQDYLGMEIPIYVGIAATYTYQRVTEDWKHSMNELARHLTDMPAYIEQNKEKIFPMKELNDSMMDLLTVDKQKAIEVEMKRRRKV